MRDGNESRYLLYPTNKSGLKPTYEGWKLGYGEVPLVVEHV